MSRSGYKPLDEDLTYKSYLMYKSKVDYDYKVGVLTREQAHQYLEQAKKNYRRQEYNRQLELVNAQN